MADTQPRMLGAPSVLPMRRELLHRAMQVRAILQQHVKEALWRRKRVERHVCSFASFGLCSAWDNGQHSPPALAVAIFCQKDEEVCKALVTISAGISNEWRRALRPSGTFCSVLKHEQRSGCIARAKSHDEYLSCGRTKRMPSLSFPESNRGCSVTVWGI